MQHTIKNVTALWPRINRPYKFDSVEQRSAPCDAVDPMGAYEMSFEMSRDAAKDLWAEMLKAYASKKQAGWPDKPVSPFKTSDDGTVIGKVKLKSSYNGELTKAPLQVDAANKKLPDDFLLTTGSTVNLAVTFVPYNMREAGVSMRPRAVQVLEYKPMEEQNPFEVTTGYAAPAQDDPFGSPPVKAAKYKASPDDDLDDDCPF